MEEVLESVDNCVIGNSKSEWILIQKRKRRRGGKALKAEKASLTDDHELVLIVT
jgi:hypothetical protein